VRLNLTINNAEALLSGGLAGFKDILILAFILEVAARLTLPPNLYTKYGDKAISQRRCRWLEMHITPCLARARVWAILITEC